MASEHSADTHTRRSSSSSPKRNAPPKRPSRSMSRPPPIATKTFHMSHMSSRWEASPSFGKLKDSSLSPVRRTDGVKLTTPLSTRPHPESLVTSGAQIVTDHHQRANAVPRGNDRKRPVALIQQAVDIISDLDSISSLC
jgi:hypothetical protein